MLVIAIALFFSTFSSPMLSAVFAFGLYVAGHFSADLKNFDVAVGDSPVAVRDDRPVLPAAEHGDVRREERRRARPARAGRLRGHGDALRRSPTSSRWLPPRSGSFRGGTSSDTGWRPSIVAGLLAQHRACRSRASAGIPTVGLAGRRGVLHLRRRAATTAGAVVQVGARRRLLDSRHPVLCGHAARGQADRRRRDLLFPLLDITTSPRSGVQHRLPLRRDLPRRAAPEWRWPARSWPSSSSTRALRRTPTGGITCTTRRLSTTGRSAIRKAAAHWFGEAAKVPGSAEWLPGLAAIHAGGRRRPAQLAIPVPADAADRRARVHAEERGVPAGATRHPGRDRPAQRRCSTATQQVTGTRADDLGAAGRAQLAARRARRPGRHALHRSTPTDGAALDPASKFNPLPIEPASTAAGAGRRRRRVPRPPA